MAQFPRYLASNLPTHRHIDWQQGLLKASSARASICTGMQCMYVGCIDIVLADGAQFIHQLIACYHAELIDFCFTPHITKVLLNGLWLVLLSRSGRRSSRSRCPSETRCTCDQGEAGCFDNVWCLLISSWCCFSLSYCTLLCFTNFSCILI